MKPLEGVRVLEMASFVFVPVTGSVLADWGADVIKIEHPVTGDPTRGLSASSQGGARVSASAGFQILNRGKRSVGLDVSTDEGRSVLYKLVESADVFLTNLLPRVREKLRVDVDDIRAHNPDIIYAKGSGLGPRGAQQNRGGFDLASYWSRGGVAATFQAQHESLEYPPRQLGGFGDMPSGAILAGGVAAALARRKLHGETSVVDVSLLSFALWQLAGATGIGAADSAPAPGSRLDTARFDLGAFATSDQRYVAVSATGDDAAFRLVCERLGMEQLPADDRFATDATRRAHRSDLIAALGSAFAARTLHESCRALQGVDWAWDPVDTVFDLVEDPMVEANEYIVSMQADDGTTRRVVPVPVQFNERAAEVSPAPDHGVHTDEVLLDAGYDWDQLIELKFSGGVL